MTLYLVRHGEIQSNLDKVYAGWNEEPLTERGIRQAQRAGEALKEKEIDALYCSPLQRAVQTAQIMGEAIGKVPVTDDHFKEMRLGPWEGLSEDQIADAYPEEWRIWNERPADLVLEGRETLAELQERVLEGMWKLGKRIEEIGKREEGERVRRSEDSRHPSETPSGDSSELFHPDETKGGRFHRAGAARKAVVVTHVAIIRVLKLYAEGRDLNEYKKVPVGNGEIFEIADGSWLMADS